MKGIGYSVSQLLKKKNLKLAMHDCVVPMTEKTFPVFDNTIDRPLFKAARCVSFVTLCCP